MNAKYVKCAAKFCGNTLLDNSNLTFFTFPENKELANVWAKNAKISYFYYGSTLCSDHFEDKYFNTKFGKKSVFRQDMEPIPTIFGRDSKKEQDPQPHVTLVDPLKIISEKKSEAPPDLDTKEYCRLCATQFSIKNLRQIFSKYNNMIDICLPGKVIQNDELSQYICFWCIQKVTSCSKTLEKFQEADKKLREMLTEKTPSTSQTCQDSQDESEIINISDDESVTDFTEKDLLDDLMNVLTETNNILDEIANDPLNVSDSEDSEKETITKFRFQCLRCSSVFDHKVQVIIHAFHEHPYNRNDKVICRVIPHKVKVNKIERPRVKKYHCTNCNIIFDTKDLINIHSTKVHNGNKHLIKLIEVAEVPQKVSVLKYMCLSCPLFFNSPKDILTHARICHKGNKIVSKTIHCEKPLNEILPLKNTRENTTVNVTRYDNETRVPNSFGTPYTRRIENVEPIINFNVKYKCTICSLLENSYNEIYEHFQQNHSDVETDSYAIVCKVKENSESTDTDLIEINDGTIMDIDPSAKPEKRLYKKIQSVSETAFKCLSCNKIFRTKQILVRHALAKHPNVDGLTEINCKTVNVQRKVNTYMRGKDRLECLHCCSLHTSEFSLLRHTELLHPNISENKFAYRFLDHQKKGPIQCLHCSYVSKTFSQYCNHTRFHLSFKCHECSKKFTKISILRQHEKEHNPTKETTWNCLVCNEEFTNRLLLYKHESIHKKPEDVQCTKCNKKFQTMYDLKKHEKTHETCLCDVCGKTYELPYIRNHLQTHNKDNPYKCKICGKGFKTSSILCKHQNKHKTKSEKTLCQICGKVICRASIPLHMKTHSTKKDEVCDICGASFYRKDHLRLHRARHASERGTYECNQCSLTIYSRKAYTKHMSTVHNINEISPDKKLFQCTICDKQFSQKPYLADHYRWHKGEKIYPCETCGKKFGTKIAVYQHRLIHLPYEQFKYHCNVCNKRFKRGEQFRNHKRIHTGEKPFPCPICQRPFRVRGEMVKHMRIHVPKENRDIKIKAKPKPPTPDKEKVVTHIIKPHFVKTYTRKLQSIKSVNIPKDIFQKAKKVKLTPVKTNENQTIFFIDENISSDSLIEIGENMPDLE